MPVTIQWLDLLECRFWPLTGFCRVSRLIIIRTRRVYCVNWNLDVSTDSCSGNRGLEAA